ncbi:hypothetical protein CLAFUW4_10741 [Fulvia fulva]|uniref:Uncharacterized protein n=1 Tax=Passalora fulva TaxID=5499 RepID=A0A9Q8P7F2_PASFU|nr:uncharacterized protein CLAFUR5_05354 [Fulvia fulva]KAK4615954.1 hypothetical protein CLAFUR4_10746 [Fulvia fulva]KAK4616523.1 hypothetical protein CLAFUR0_10753 [Fulvia fulva]UJO16049.1 hypothetical protein CLAFUR5_05354 [Fulvia fulva]WPV19772.1 hypothetical protein CLAFUW4_10741 [Fulvia fulva]WPV33706.1 hypothetical protein CLAFUW7_10743 [Fulvia fulva]
MHPAETFKPGQRTHFDDLPQEIRDIVHRLLIPDRVTIRSHHYHTDANGAPASIDGIELLNKADWQLVRSMQLVSRDWNYSVKVEMSRVALSNMPIILFLDLISHPHYGAETVMPVAPGLVPTFIANTASFFSFFKFERMKTAVPFILVDYRRNPVATNFNQQVWDAQLRTGFPNDDHLYGEIIMDFTTCKYSGVPEWCSDIELNVLNRDPGFTRQWSFTGELFGDMHDMQEQALQQGLSVAAINETQQGIINLWDANNGICTTGDAEKWLLYDPNLAIDASCRGDYRGEYVLPCVDLNTPASIDGVYKMRDSWSGWRTGRILRELED